VHVVVTDERSVVVETFSFPRFIGDLASNVEYVLEADVEGASFDGCGLVEVESLLGEAAAAGNAGFGMGVRGLGRSCSGGGPGTVMVEGVIEGGGKGAWQGKTPKRHPLREKVRHVGPRIFF